MLNMWGSREKKTRNGFWEDNGESAYPITPNTNSQTGRKKNCLQSLLQNAKKLYRLPCSHLTKQRQFILLFRAITRNIGIQGREISPSGRNDTTSTVHFVRDSTE